MASPGVRHGGVQHESFLRHAGFRWLKVALGVSLAAILVYAFADFTPSASGDTWYGYATGTIGALLIVWLTLLGLRKRAMTPGQWSLKAWTSAHVYLGLALIVVATLHTGFRFGWNVHTLAYALMMLVIASGVFGVVAYATLPAALSNNREETTETQMVEGIRAIDRQLEAAAQPLDRARTDLVLAAMADDGFAGSLRNRLTGNYPRCATRRAVDALARTDNGDPAADKVAMLLARREAQLGRLRRHLRLRALLEVWLYVHVPATIALLAALATHVVAEFYYW
ncbi:MAG TPA: hypothetical protein VF440_00880 [Novosphingobium sp.]